MGRVLGGYEFPYNPPRGSWSGVQPKKSRTDLQTLTSNISLIWGFVHSDTPVVEEWPMMHEEFWEALKALYLMEDGTAKHEYELEDGRKFTVEIMELEGRPWVKDGITGVRYYRNVELTLKILGEIK